MNRYRIAARDNAGIVASGKPAQYWSHKDGWCEIGAATLYLHAREPLPDSSLLPVAGVWEPDTAVPVKYLAESPEVDHDALCPHCGTERNWIGLDLGCTLRQPFSGGDYEDYEDEGIGEYEVIQCGYCHNVIWYAQAYFVPDESADLLEALAHGPYGRESLVTLVKRLLEGRRVRDVPMWGDEAPCIVVTNDQPRQEVTT